MSKYKWGDIHTRGKMGFGVFVAEYGDFIQESMKCGECFHSASQRIYNDYLESYNDLYEGDQLC